MKVYLVRHGETGGNVAHRHQAEDTPLNFKGIEQAEIVAEKIKDLHPTNLVSSSLVRTVQTASVIGEATGLVTETSADFIELTRPSNMYGRYHRSIKSIIFFAQWYLGRKSDGESYKEIRQRVEKAQAYFDKFDNEAVVVLVSHSLFINFFVAHICDKSSLSLWQFYKVFDRILHMPNTKIVSVEYDKNAPQNTCTWSVGTEA